MKVPVLILPLETGAGYRGSLGSPFNVTAEGTTANDVVGKLQVMAGQQTLSAGEIHWIDVPATTDGPEAVIGPRFQIGQGWLPDDDLTREWLECMNENRRKADEEERLRIEEEDREKARQAS